MLRGQEYGEYPLLPSVRQWVDWKILNVLPKAGGTLDQDPEFMKDIRTIMSIENSFESNKTRLAEVQRELASKGPTGRKL
jgi:hypothetical protein